ncbi:TPA: ROK family protein [bacterium]|nr:ROK family protein [bacterium]
MKYCLSIDIGASNIRLAIIDEQYKIINKVKEGTNKDLDLSEQIFLLYPKLNNKLKLEVVSVGVAGSLDFKRGLIRDVPGLNIFEYDLKSKLEDSFKVDVIINNDASLGAMGEYLMFDKEGVFQYITISTGIGGGLVYKDKLFKGHLGFEQEIGRMIIRDNKTFEQLCSGTALKLNLIKANFNFKYPSDSLVNKDAKHQDIIKNWVSDLAIGVSNVIKIINPSIIVFGGGLGKFLDYYKEDLVIELSKYLPTEVLTELLLEKSRLEDDNVLVGASYLAFNKE